MVRNKKIRNMTLVAVGAVIIVACSLITVPAAIPFTMQSFGIFLVLFNLGGKRGTLSVLVYIALGLCGIPVFANFGAGIGVLFGPTGGYIFGFLAAAAFYWFMETRFGKKLIVKLLSMWCGMLIYYVLGTAVYMLWSAANGNYLAFGAALLVCVVPYIIPDILKLVIACRTINYFEKLNLT